MRFVVAIDGPAAAGKGTISKAVAERFGFAHLDTGLLYRAVGKRALDQGRGVIDEGVAELVARELREADLADPDLRGRWRRGRPAGSRRCRACARRCWISSGASRRARAGRCWTGATSAP